MPAVLPGWTPGRASARSRKPTVFQQPIGSVQFQPVPLRERQLPPPAQIPAFPVKRSYTKQEQATIVRGTEKAAHGVNHDELLAHPVTYARLEPYFRVKAQQEAEANRQYARGFGGTPQQAAIRRAASNAVPAMPASAGVSAKQLLGIGAPSGDFLHRLAHALLTGDTGQGVRLSDGTTYSGADPSRYAAQQALRQAVQPAIGRFNPLGATYEKAPDLPYTGPAGLGTLSAALGSQSARNTQIAGDAGMAISRDLRQASKRTRSGSGGTAITPAFLRSPLADVLLAASKAAPVVSRVGAGAANDLGQYILGAVPSIAQMGSQTVSQGPGAAARTLIKGTLDIAKHPLDHPLFAAQLLHGGESAIARPIGALGRSGLVGKTAQRAFSTERAPLAIGGPAAQRLVEYRHFSKDPLVKGAQALLDRTLPEGPTVRYHGRDVVTRQAKDSPLASMLGRDTAGRLRSYGDFTADRANAVERANRASMQRDLLQGLPTREHTGWGGVGNYLDRRLPAGPSGRIRGPQAMYRPEHGILGLVMTGVVRSAKTFEADLRTRLGHLQQQTRFAHPAEREANRAAQQAIRNVLEDPKALANAERTVAAGRDLAKQGRAFTAEAVKSGALKPEAAARAPLFDYALTHMGARYHTVDEHRALEAQARAVERQHADRVAQIAQQLKAKGAPLIHEDEVAAFTHHSAVKEPLYTVRSSGTARAIQTEGLDPNRAKFGSYGAGVYFTTKGPAWKGESALIGHADIRRPLVLKNEDTAQVMKPFYDQAREAIGHDLSPKNRQAFIKAVRDAVEKAGYDGVIVKGAAENGGDFVVSYRPHQARVLAPKTTVRTGPVDRATAAQIAKDSGVRLTAHRSDNVSSTVEFAGSREGARRAGQALADHSETTTRIFHELDGAGGAGYYVDGKLVWSEPHLLGATLRSLKDRYGGRLEVRHGDAEDIRPAVQGRVPAAREEARGANPSGAAGGLARDRAEASPEALAAAQEAHARAREYRIAVSGRHPELVKRHEAAQAQVAQARRKAQVAAAEHARAEKARQRLIGVQSSRRGRRMAEGAGAATKAEGAKIARADQTLAAAKARRQAAEAAHREARANVPGLPDVQAGLRHADGRYLPNEEIHAHMQANGIPVDQHGPVISYLPHAPDITGRGSFHRAQALLRRDSLEGYQRTGAAFQKGITGSGHDLIAEHLIRMGITTGRGAIGQFDQLVHDAGVKRHDGTLFTPKEAALEAKNLSDVPGQPRLIPVRVFAARASKGQQAIIRTAQDPLALDPMAFGVRRDLGHYIEQAFLDRTNMAKDPQARNVVLMPEDLVSRFQKHVTATANRSPLGTIVARSFRTAVLPFSVKWLTGNVAEAALRLAIIGANPLDYAAGRKVITELKGRDAKTLFGREMMKQIIGLDAERAGTSTEAQASLLGGLFYGDRGLTIHRDARDFADSRLRVPAEMIGGLGKTTVARELGHTLGQIPEGMFALNRVLERQAQITALGRYVRRDIQEFSKSWLKSALLQRTAIRQAARGLFDTAQQRDAARFMDVTLGQYSRFSPKLRAFIQTAAPFLPWYLNSVRFVFWTLPVGHPLKTAALNAAEVAFHADWQQQHKDLPPGELKSAVPSQGGSLDLARFTPFGMATPIAGGDLSTIASPVFPQAQGILHALQGQDPFGRPLQVPKTPSNPTGKATPGDIVKSVIDQGFGSFLPGYAPAERVAQHGETAYGNSSLLFGIKTKPGSSHGYSGLGRWLDPLRPVYLKPKKTAAGTSSGWGSGSSSGSGWGGSSATTSGWGG